MTAAAFDLADLTGDTDLTLVVPVETPTDEPADPTPPTLLPITKGAREKIEVTIPYEIWSAGSPSALDIRRDERIGRFDRYTRTWSMTRQKAAQLAAAILRRGSDEARDAAELIALAAGCLAPHAAQARAERVERARIARNRANRAARLAETRATVMREAHALARAVRERDPDADYRTTLGSAMRELWALYSAHSSRIAQRQIRGWWVNRRVRRTRRSRVVLDRYTPGTQTKWGVVERCVGPFRVDADMPSIEGSHLLGCEDDWAWRIIFKEDDNDD